MKAIGLSSPSCQQRSMTSWQRRCISGFWRCTEAKSRSSCPSAGHARRRTAAEADQHRRPAEDQQGACAGANSGLSTCSGAILPLPPAIMIGLW
jgi:hypothetical protein